MVIRDDNLYTQKGSTQTKLLIDTDNAEGNWDTSHTYEPLD